MEERVPDISRDHGIPGKDVLLGDVFKNKAGQADISEIGVEGDELSGEEDVMGAAGGDEEGVEALGKVRFGAGEEEEVEIHVLVVVCIAKR